MPGLEDMYPAPAHLGWTKAEIMGPKDDAFNGV